MKSAQTFAYALLIQSPERAEKILALLDESKREEVVGLLAGFERLSADDLRRIWSEQRKAEEVMAGEALRERLGVTDIQEMTPGLAEWLAERRA